MSKSSGVIRGGGNGGNGVNYENFYKYTTGVFSPLKNRPAREPDYVSRNLRGGISSEYWYGHDSRGDYVIRGSDHWSDYSGQKVPADNEKRWKIDRDFEKARYNFNNAPRFNSIASCYWSLKLTPRVAKTFDDVANAYAARAKMDRTLYGKIYLKNLEKRFSVKNGKKEYMK